MFFKYFIHVMVFGNCCYVVGFHAVQKALLIIFICHIHNDAIIVYNKSWQYIQERARLND